jgi:hypothetical protein
MAFRAEIIKMIEDHVEVIELYNYKITSQMKTQFVNFVNEFSKAHLGTTNIDYRLTANILFAEMGDLRIIIATDADKEYQVPGSNIPMREQIEAFILCGNNVCYDSVSMRVFRKIAQTDMSTSQPVYVGFDIKKIRAEAESCVKSPVVEKPAMIEASVPSTPTLNFMTSTPTLQSFPQISTTPVQNTAPSPPTFSTPAITFAPPSSTPTTNTSLFSMQPPAPAQNTFQNNSLSAFPAPTPPTTFTSQTTNTFTAPKTNSFMTAPSATTFTTMPATTKPSAFPSSFLQSTATKSLDNGNKFGFSSSSPKSTLNTFNVFSATNTATNPFGLARADSASSLSTN